MIDREQWIDVAMSVQRALLGCVTPNLRAVGADWDDREVRVFCFYEGEISDEIKELMSVAETEVATDFVDAKAVYFHLIRRDPPRKPDGYLRTIFQRAE